MAIPTGRDRERLERSNRNTILVGTGFTLLPALLIAAYAVVVSLLFSINVTDNLKLAADASNLERASEKVGLAIEYLDEHEINYGHSNVFFERGSNDVGYWYENIVGAKLEADEAIAAEMSSGDRDLALLQVRKVLVDGDERVTLPTMVALFPHQRIVVFGLLLSLLLPAGFILVNKRKILKSTTMVEVMIVISIIGILAAIALPQLLR